ncbi:hypothetical protein [Pseudogemmobacter bohemicus]|uniref:hypothetical protein n=1 Tax=Pseudogemmobacter bohemicus TaxID=2250708 RepID=UPI000DD3E4BC|nr:hypothetical protein [Pseudogemmobacter bohemicus]
MMRREFLTAAPAVAFTPVAAIASAQMSFAPQDPLVAMIARMEVLRDAFQIAPDPTGNFDSPECVAIMSEIDILSDQIDAAPIRSADGLAAYCRNLMEESRCVELVPERLAKILTWAEGVPQ